jgi:integrase
VSVYKDPRSPYWQFDFQWRGHRFHGSTKATNKREAEKVEDAEREKAKAHVAQIAAAKTSLRLDDIAGRYWSEHAEHLAAAATIEGILQLLIQFFGKDKLITDITGDDVAKLVAWRRGHRARNNALISPFTVNHTVEQLRKLFTRAKLWGVRFEHEPKWSKHLLPVPDERVRELSDDEAERRLERHIRDDYAPIFAFARATGWRLSECLLKWNEVDWGSGQIRKPGKGGKPVVTHITSTVREILWPLQGDHAEHVFTYVPLQGDPARRPITRRGLQSMWKRLRRRAGVSNLRFHDLRHDFGTKFLRETQNLKLTQKAMNHRDIKTTLRYAHVLDSEVAEALERMQKSRSKSRKLKIVM